MIIFIPTYARALEKNIYILDTVNLTVLIIVLYVNIVI